MEVVNILESLVWSNIDAVLDRKQNVCKCSKCRADIAALTLNSIKPRYVVSDRGAIIARTDCLDSKFVHELILALASAVEIVTANPRHEKEVII